MAGPAAPLLIGGALELGKKLLGHFFPDKEKQAEHAAELAKLEQSGQLQAWLAEVGLLAAVHATNQAEAQHPSKFVAGWRPAIGWVCAISMGIYYIPRFLVGTALWTMQAYAMWKAGTPGLPPMPEMGIGDIIGLVLALLGMAGIRSFDKMKGTARESL